MIISYEYNNNNNIYNNKPYSLKKNLAFHLNVSRDFYTKEEKKKKTFSERCNEEENRVYNRRTHQGRL